VRINFKKNSILLMLVMILVFFTPQKIAADTIDMEKIYENNVSVRFIPKKTGRLPQTGDMRMGYLQKVGTILILLIFIGVKDKHIKKNK